MDAGGAGASCADTADGELDFLAHIHHEVGQLVDDDDDVGDGLAVEVLRRLSPFPFGSLVGRLGRSGLLVEGDDVAHAALREHLQAPLHLGHGPGKGAGGLAALGDHGDVQVRDAS